MRLSEATGLKVSDIKVDGPTPHVHIRPNPIRMLKTKQSERQVPLVGGSLWSAKRVLANSVGDYAFLCPCNLRSINRYKCYSIN